MSAIHDEVPSIAGTRIVAAGRDWDAVRMPRFIGLQTLNALKAPPGAIAVEPGARSLYFFVPPGTTRTWHLPQSTALGETNHVVLPPDGKELPPGPYWLISPLRGRLHTDTDALHTALEIVLGPRSPDADPDQPNLDRITPEQARGWRCALCGAELIIDRPLGMFCTGAGLLARPTALFACEPRCR